MWAFRRLYTIITAITNINDPIIVLTIITKKRNTNILLALVFIPLARTSASVRKRANFKTLKIRSSRNKRITPREDVFKKINSKNNGKMANKSIIPKVLKTYFFGLVEVHIRSIYSIQKIIVIINSKVKSTPFQKGETPTL